MEDFNEEIEIVTKFIFYDLKPTLLEELTKQFKSYDLDIAEQPSSSNKILTLNNIENGFNSTEILKVIDEYNLDPNKYGILLNVTTNYSPLYLELSSKIKEIYKETGGTMRISFILDYF